MAPALGNTDAFLGGEGNAWFQRNLSQGRKSFAEEDLLLPMLLSLPLAEGNQTRVLEVGCSNGWRLERLREQKGWDIYGIDPSEMAISKAVSESISAQVGTAESLPFPGNHFDLVIFGFCLYLCDRDDLFLIASEAHRVLKSTAWIGMIDFWAEAHYSVPYSHHHKVLTHKFDNTKIFSWHPSYIVMDNVIRAHGGQEYTDDASMFVSASILRKTSLPSRGSSFK